MHQGRARAAAPSLSISRARALRQRVNRGDHVPTAVRLSPARLPVDEEARPGIVSATPVSRSPDGRRLMIRPAASPRSPTMTSRSGSSCLDVTQTCDGSSLFPHDPGHRGARSRRSRTSSRGTNALYGRDRLAAFHSGPAGTPCRRSPSRRPRRSRPRPCRRGSCHQAFHFATFCAASCGPRRSLGRLFNEKRDAPSAHPLRA